MQGKGEESRGDIRYYCVWILFPQKKKKGKKKEYPLTETKDCNSHKMCCYKFARSNFRTEPWEELQRKIVCGCQLLKADEQSVFSSACQNLQGVQSGRAVECERWKRRYSVVGEHPFWRKNRNDAVTVDVCKLACILHTHTLFLLPSSTFFP